MPSVDHQKSAPVHNCGVFFLPAEVGESFAGENVVNAQMQLRL